MSCDQHRGRLALRYLSRRGRASGTGAASITAFIQHSPHPLLSCSTNLCEIPEPPHLIPPHPPTHTLHAPYPPCRSCIAPSLTSHGWLGQLELIPVSLVCRASPSPAFLLPSILNSLVQCSKENSDGVFSMVWTRGGGVEGCGGGEEAIFRNGLNPSTITTSIKLPHFEFAGKQT